jgi:hypothetical protein
VEKDTNSVDEKELKASVEVVERGFRWHNHWKTSRPCTPYLQRYGKWQRACIIHISVVQLPTNPKGSDQNAHHCKSETRKETTNLMFLISLNGASTAFGAFAFACALLLLLTEIFQSSSGYAVECTHSFSRTLNPSAFANTIWNLDGCPDSWTNVTSRSCEPLVSLNISAFLAVTCLALLIVIRSYFWT